MVFFLLFWLAIFGAVLFLSQLVFKQTIQEFDFFSPKKKEPIRCLVNLPMFFAVGTSEIKIEPSISKACFPPRSDHCPPGSERMVLPPSLCYLLQETKIKPESIGGKICLEN